MPHFYLYSTFLVASLCLFVYFVLLKLWALCIIYLCDNNALWIQLWCKLAKNLVPWKIKKGKINYFPSAPLLWRHSKKQWHSTSFKHVLNAYNSQSKPKYYYCSIIYLQHNNKTLLPTNCQLKASIYLFNAHIAKYIAI